LLGLEEDKIEETTIKGNKIVNSGRSAIDATHTVNLSIYRNIIQDNIGHGLDISNSELGIIENNKIMGNLWGIKLDEGSHHTIKDNIIKDNVGPGIFFNGISDSFVIGNRITNNSDYWGVGLAGDSILNIIEGNYIQNHELGIFIFEEAESNMIYNNYLNNSINAEIDNILMNFWNIVDTPGKNIVGGPYLGGNYWANPDGTGYSQTCESSHGDGICDEPYVLNENNVDYLPLTLN